MPYTHEHCSEVAHLLEEISKEYAAAQMGMAGLALGSSQHRLITKRMERIGGLHSQLHTMLGDKAMELIAARLDETGLDSQV
jgi:hypothetical protein